MCPDHPATSVRPLSHPPCPPAVSPSPPAPTMSVIPHSWPAGRRAVWLPCIQRHFSPDLAGLPLWGAFSRVRHFGRAKRRSVYEDDRVLGDGEQKVGHEKLRGEGSIRTSTWVHEGEYGGPRGLDLHLRLPKGRLLMPVGRVLGFHLCYPMPSSQQPCKVKRSLQI